MDRQTEREIRRMRAEIQANDDKEKKLHEKGQELRARLRKLENEAIMSEVSSTDMPAELMTRVVELFKEGKLKDLVVPKQDSKEDVNE